MIIAGHCRFEAAKLLGMTEVPCIVLEGFSDAQKRAYVIADNKLALNAGWDFDLLRDEFEALKDDDFSLELTAFSATEIGNLSFVDNDSESGGESGGESGESKAKEVDVSDFDLGNKCPRCGFEFND